MHSSAIHTDLAAAVGGEAIHFFGKGILDAAETGGYVDDFWIGGFMEERQEGGRDYSDGGEVGGDMEGVNLAEGAEGGGWRSGEEDPSVVDENWFSISSYY